MPWVAAAAVAAAAIGAAASNSAAKKQASAANQASDMQRGMFNATRADLAPWMTEGKMSLDKLSYLMGIDTGAGPNSLSPKGGSLFKLNGRDPTPGVYEVGATPTVNAERYNSDPIYKKAWDTHLANHVAQYGKGYTGDSNADSLAAGLNALMAQDRAAQGIPDPSIGAEQDAMSDPAFGSLSKPFGLQDFQESPAYQFNLSEGRKAIEKAAASRGTMYAPQTLQDIGKYSQGLASNEFQNAFSNYNTNMKNIWDRLYALSGTGQNAAAQTGGFGTQVGGQIGENMVGAGNAQAAGIMGGANAFTGAMGQGYNAYMMNQMLANNQQGSVPMSSLRSNPSYTGSGDLNQYYS